MLAPVPEFELAGQAIQVIAPVWPTYCPAVQARHARLDDRPVPVPYVPAKQAVQGELGVVEYVPAKQVVQAELTCAPSTVENFPATQAWHVVSAMAPRFVEYVPARHWVQLALVGMPIPVWYVPAMHDRQV